MAHITELGDGKFRVFINDGYKENGKRNRISKVIKAKSMKDAEKQANLLYADLVVNGEKGMEEYTFMDAAEKWRELVAPKLADITSQRYNSILDGSVLPKFGHKKLSNIKALEIETYINKLSLNGARKDSKEGGYSQQTIKHHYRVISMIFERARRWEMVQSNPCDLADSPVVRSEKKKSYKPEEVSKIIELLENEKLKNKAEYKYKAFFNLALATGARKGEILGLEWKDINFTEKTISICRVSQQVSGKGLITKEMPKNEYSIRTISIPSETIEILKEYKDYQNSIRFKLNTEYINTDRLFIQGNGKAMGYNTVNKWFNEFTKRHELPRLTIHELRHTHISNLIHKKIDIVAVAKRAGHANPAETLRTYSHVIEGADKLSAETIGDIMYN